MSFGYLHYVVTGGKSWRDRCTLKADGVADALEYARRHYMTVTKKDSQPKSLIEVGQRFIRKDAESAFYGEIAEVIAYLQKSNWRLKWLTGPAAGAEFSSGERVLEDPSFWDLLATAPVEIPCPDGPKTMNVYRRLDSVTIGTKDPCWSCYTGDSEMKHTCSPPFDSGCPPGAPRGIDNF